MAMDYYHNQEGMKLKQEVEEEEEEEEVEEDDYIDMEVGSFTNSLSHSMSSNTSTSTTTTTTIASAASPNHPHPCREFEFQTKSSSNALGTESPSPADELFYKGKLLPLLLPSRLLMFEKLNTHFTTPSSITSFASCNISPATSCPVSRELCPDDYVRDYFTNQGQDDREGGSLLDNYDNFDVNLKRSWTRKLKTRIKVLFGKSLVAGCSVQSSVLIKNEENYEQLEKQIKRTQKNPLGENESKDDNGGIFRHRRSFSGAFKRRCSMQKLSSSSSCSSTSSNSSRVNDVEMLKRSSNANIETESSLIQGAIAHCKNSQQVVRSRKALNEVGAQSLDSSRVGNQARQTGVCRV